MVFTSTITSESWITLSNIVSNHFKVLFNFYEQLIWMVWSHIYFMWGRTSLAWRCGWFRKMVGRIWAISRASSKTSPTRILISSIMSFLFKFCTRRFVFIRRTLSIWTMKLNYYNLKDVEPKNIHIFFGKKKEKKNIHMFGRIKVRRCHNQQFCGSQSWIWTNKCGEVWIFLVLGCSSFGIF